MDKVFVLGAAFQNDAIADGWGNEGDMVINANDFRSTTESIGVALNDLVDRDLEISFIMLMLHAKPSPLWSTNLTAACTDPANLFQASNVYNCMQIAAHALLVQNGSMFVNESTFADPELAGVVVPDLNTFDGGKVLETVVDCAINSCGDQTLGSCMPSVLALKGIKATADSLQMISDGLVTYCDGAQSIYNADIAGPGVVVSYLTQAFFVLTFSILLKFLTSWLRPVFFPFKWREQCRNPTATSDTTRPELSKYEAAWMMAGRVQSRISQKRPSTALISVLLEFQEVQGFFIIAIQLATLATFGSNGGAGSLSSISSFINFFANVLLVQTFAVNGIMPILLLQCVLQRAGVRWWYLLGITLISLVLAVIIQVRSLTLGPDFATLWNYFKDRAPVMACGGNPSPMTYCTARIDEITFLADNGLDQSLTVAGIAAASLLIQQAFWTLTKRVRRLGVELRRMEAQSQLFRVVRRRVLPPAIALYWLGIQVTLFYFVGTYLALLLNIAQAVGMDASSWTYGQLIAVMVWAPTIGKYIYFNFFGVEEGLTKRLSKYFKVVRRKPEELEESASPPEKLGFEQIGIKRWGTALSDTETLYSGATEPSDQKQKAVLGASR